MVEIEQDVEVEKRKEFYEVLHVSMLKGFKRVFSESSETQHWSCPQERRNAIFTLVQAETEEREG